MPALSFELVADDVSTGEVDGGVTVSEPYEEAVRVFEDVLHVVDAMAALFGPDMEAEAGPGVASTKRARIRRFSNMGASGYRGGAALLGPGRKLWGRTPRILLKVAHSNPPE